MPDHRTDRLARLSTAAWVAIVAGMAGLAGSPMTWASAMTSVGSTSRSGLAEGHGKVTAAAAVLLVVCVAASNGKRTPLALATVAAVIGLLISIYHWGYVQDEINGSESEVTSVSVGLGLYLCTFGFIICVGALVSAISDNPDSGARR